MLRINRPPSQPGYTVELRAAALQAEVRGGLDRARRDLVRPAHIASVSYGVNAAEAEGFFAFYDRIATTGEPFEAELLIGSFALEPHVCHMIPGSFEVRWLAGGNARVSFRAEVTPSSAYSEAADLALLDFFEAYQAEGADVFNLLARLVNEDLPN